MPDHSTHPPFEGSAIPHAGTYRRALPVSMERMFENALDWEHLPYLHRSSFSGIRALEAGRWGWRAQVTSARGDASVIELRLDTALRRWITRTLEGRGAGAEVWTHAFELAPRRIEVVVDFFVPGLEGESLVRAGEAYARLYARLYDEDVAMMSGRQRALDTRIEAVPDGASLSMGPRAGLALPSTVVLGGRAFVICEVDGELHAFPRDCPHQMGPLDEGEVTTAGIVTCPWHGYRFDVRSGECVSGQGCRMLARPEVDASDAADVRVRYRRP